MRSGLCIPNMVYLDQFVCLSDGVNLKVVATSIAEIDRPVYHDVRNSMPHPIGRGFLFRTPSKFGRSYFVLNGRRHFVFAPIGAEAN